MRTAIAFLLFCVSFASVTCLAQKILVFDRDGHAKRIRFRVHDQIAVRTADSSTWRSGEITDILDSAIIVSDKVIPVSGIDAIRYDIRGSGKHLLRELGAKLPAAGVGLLTIYAFNSVINNEYPVYSKSELITAGAFIVSGSLIYSFSYHRHKINEHHRLKVIDVSIR